MSRFSSNVALLIQIEHFWSFFFRSFGCYVLFCWSSESFDLKGFFFGLGWGVVLVVLGGLFGLAIFGPFGGFGDAG